jgi:hypothetical protein
MNLSGSLVMLATLLPGQTPGGSFYEDFRDRPLPASVRLDGPDAAEMSKTDEGGLRITLPADRAKRDPVGIRTTFVVKGNFDMAAGYEIVHSERPRSDYGVGFEFFIQTPSGEAIAFTRMIRTDGREVYGISRNTGPREKRQYKGQFFDTVTRSGRLRMSRSGSEVTCWASEGAADEYRELCRLDLGTEDLRIVRLAAYTGNSPASVDVHIVDLRIGTDAPGEDMRRASAETAEKGTASKSSLLPLLIVGLVVAGIFALSAAFYLRRRRHTVAEENDTSDTPLITFACPQCGKNLKTRADLAGRKAKCSQCGAIVVVPPAHEGAPATGSG